MQLHLKTVSLPTLAIVSLVLHLAACQAPAPPPKIHPSAGILHFKAAPSQVLVGESIELTWITSHASSFTLTANGEPLQIPSESWARGSIELVVEKDSLFRLEILGPGGDASSEERAVEVLIEPLVKIEAFDAAPPRIAAGQSATLSWRTTNATGIRIVDDLGRHLGLEGSVPAEGSISIRPERSTTYELEATGPGGKVRKTASIELAPIPQLSATASASSVVYGEEATLRWQAQGADRLRIWEDEELLDELPLSDPAQGELTIQPVRAAAYRLEASGLGGSAVARLTVEVIPSIESFEARGAPAELRVGMDGDLGWRVHGADSLALVDLHGLIATIDDPEQIMEGSILAPIRAGGLFELIARSGEQTVTQELVLRLTQAPIITAFSVDSPQQSASADRPALVTLRWETHGARSLFLRTSPGKLVSLPPDMSGGWELEVYGPTSLQLIAENPWGLTDETIDAKVEAFPTILRFEALADRVAPGASATLRWETSGASSIELWQDGILVAARQEAAGEHEAVIAADSHFELRAYNSIGDEVRAERAVTLGAPRIESFGTNRRFFAPGETIAFRWTTGGADELELRGDDGAALFSTSDPELIRSGSLTAPAPSAAGEAGYTLLLTNDAGTTSITAAIEITEGPIIQRFTSHFERITAGDEVELRWSVRSGSSGLTPTLSLVDDRGGSHPIDGDAARLVLDHPGTLLFSLRASDQRGFSEAAVQVEVLPAPALLALGATPPYASAEGDPVLIHWESEHASQLELLPADDEGAIVGGAVYQTATHVAAGSFEFHPSLEAPHLLLLLQNELGAVRSFPLRVGVDPPTIVRFEAIPSSVQRGEASTLVWETERSTRLLLEASPWVESHEAFIELSAKAGALSLSIGPGQSETALLPFPEGFVFPFDGSTRKAVRVANAGYLSFDLLMEQGNSSVSNFPDPNNRYVHLAPFLGRLSPGSGELLYALLGEGEGRHLVIQFRGYALASAQEASLDFQVVLWSDGSFDYRYGQMSHPSAPAQAEGAAALIGAQDARGQRGTLFSRRAAVPGGLMGRSFHFPNVALLIPIEEVERPFLSIAGASDAIELTEGSRFFTNALYTFPPSFRFPFAGTSRSAARITKDGYLSFETTEAVSHPTNRRLAQGAAAGAGGSARIVHLAPFWANLSRIHGAGEIWAAIRNDGEGRALVIQWLRFAHESDPSSSLSFQVFLREDGSFEYRYGGMVREGGDLSTGGLASVGYQESNGVRGVDLYYREEIPGGLSGRSWRFLPHPALPSVGALEIQPRASVTYTLNASGPTGSHRKLTELEVLPPLGGPFFREEMER